jgi:hypothetical protein
MSVTRDATRCGGGRCDAAIRRMRTSLAVALPADAEPLSPSALGNGIARNVIGSASHGRRCHFNAPCRFL